MDRLQRLMIGHGLLVILVAMFAGFMLMFSLLGGFELWPGHFLPFRVYGTSEGWVRAHSGGAMNGFGPGSGSLTAIRFGDSSGTTGRISGAGVHTI